MKRKLTNRNKAKLTSLIRLAKRNDLELFHVLEIKKAIKQHKSLNRAEKRFGTYYDYCRIEKNDLLDMFFVPVMINRPNRKPVCTGYVSLSEEEVARLKGA